MKKKLNNKGFTLVELLATVVILLAISTIAVTSISAAMDRQNEKKDQEMLNLIISYGRLYIEEHKNDTSCVSISTLKAEYNLDDSVLKKSTDNSTLTGVIKFSGGEYKHDIRC